MLAVLTAAHIAAGRISSDEMSEVIAKYISPADLARALGYATPTEGFRCLSEAIKGYCKIPVGEWRVLIAKQIAPFEIPDKKLASRILLGTVRFSEVMRVMVATLSNPDSTVHSILRPRQSRRLPL
jgi:hypothetical protein